MTTEKTTKTDKKSKKPVPTISVEIVKTDGAFDLAATLAGAEAQVRRYANTAAKYDTALTASLGRVFDQYPGTRLNASALRTFVMKDLSESGEVKITPDNERAIGLALVALVQANSSLKREDGKLFRSGGKGPKGGTVRWSDIKDDTAEDAAEDDSDEELNA